MKERKPCPNPACGQLIPLAWRYCKGRRCQDTRRAHANYEPIQSEFFTRQAVVHYAAVARWKAAYWRKRTRLRDMVALSNARFRKAAIVEAETHASEELHALIAEQRRDGNYARRERWGMISLDARITEDGRTFGDSLSHSWEYWEDPTADAAINRSV